MLFFQIQRTGIGGKVPPVNLGENQGLLGTAGRNWQKGSRSRAGWARLGKLENDWKGSKDPRVLKTREETLAFSPKMREETRAFSSKNARVPSPVF